MGGLLRRRALMVTLSGDLPEWDYEWDASMGLLSDNGFVRSDVGSKTKDVAIVDDSLRFQGSISSYIDYTYPQTFSRGVMEFEIESGNNAQIQVNFGNGEYGIGVRLQTSTNYKGIYLNQGLQTQLATAAQDRKYKVRLVLKGGTGDVYVADALVLKDADVTALTGCADVLVSGRASGSTAKYSKIYTLKMRFGRL